MLTHFLRISVALSFVFLVRLSAQAATSTSLEQHGITWTFSEPVEYGTYANGEYWVKGPVTLTQISPASTGGKNGTVVNPVRGNEQGFDSRMLNSTYRSDWNISTQLPYTVGINSTVMSSISMPDTARHINHPQLKTYAILTVVEASPPAGAFRPSYINGNFNHPWTESDLNYSILPRKSIEGMDAPEIAGRSMSVPINDQDPSWRGPPKRAQDGSPSYGRDLANFVNTNLLLLCSDHSNEEKRELFVGMVQFGIDIFGILNDGGQWLPDGGHNNGRMAPLLVAALALDDASMKVKLDASVQANFQEVLQTFYVSQDDVSRSRYTRDGRPRTAYSSNDIGKPEWGEKHSQQPERDGDNWDAYYRDVAGGLLPAPAVAAHLMGARDIINHDAFFDYAKRHIYYREGYFKNPDQYNGWDDGHGYGEGNTNKSTPFSSNETVAFHKNFYLAYANDDPTVSNQPQNGTNTITVSTALTPGANATEMLDGLVIGLVPGATRADVEFKGTSDEPDTIQLRILRQSDNSIVIDWTDLATVNAAGPWTSSISLPKADDWWKAELRPASNPNSITTISEKFAVGYKVMFLGQSQMSIMMKAKRNGYEMSVENENTASFYSWQERNTLGYGESEYFYLINAENGSDGQRAFVEQFRVFDPYTPLMIMRESVNGTSILEFLDDSMTDRHWTDFTNKTQKYGGDVTCVVTSWVTANQSPLEGNEGIDILQGLNTWESEHNANIQHDLTDELQEGYSFISMPGTRHRYTATDSYRAEEIERSNELGYTVGLPTSDFELADGDSAHPDEVSDGNLRMAVRMAMAVGRDLGLTNYSNPSLHQTYRSYDGRSIYITFNLPNTGVLISTAPENLSGFLVSQDSGSTFEGTGFTARIEGNLVELRKNSGSWSNAQNLAIAKRANLSGNVTIVTAEERARVAGELFEAWSDDVLALGLPVHGLMEEGQWMMPGLAEIREVNQLAEGELPSSPTDNIVVSNPTHDFEANPPLFRWTTNTPATSILEYGQTPDYGNQLVFNEVGTSFDADIPSLLNFSHFYYKITATSTTERIASKTGSIAIPRESTEEIQLYANQESGVYETPIYVTISSSDSESTIRYTKDGSTPGPTSPSNTESIEVNGDTVLKAAAFDEDGTVLSSIEKHYHVGSKFSGGEWQNYTLAKNEDSIEATLRVTPRSEGIDGVIGLSNGQANAYDDLAVIVRFNNVSRIDVRNGSIYDSDAQYPYVEGETYFIKLSIDLSTKTYSVSVHSESEPENEVSLANDYAFRTSQGSLEILNNLALRNTDEFGMDFHNLSFFNEDRSTPVSPSAPSGLLIIE